MSSSARVVLDEDVRDERGRLGGHEFAAWIRVEPPQRAPRAVEPLGGKRGRLADLRDAVGEDVVVVALEDEDRIAPGLRRVEVRLLVEAVTGLDEQRLPHAARSDSLGLDLALHAKRRGLERRKRPVAARKMLALLAHGLERGRHEAVVVDVLDEARAGGAERRVVHLREAPLLLQLLDEAPPARGGVRHGVHLGVALAVVAHGAAAVRLRIPLVAVLSLEAAQPLELGRAPALRRLLAVFVARAAVGVVGGAGRDQLERHIALDFLLEPLGQFHGVQLQDLGGLNQLRRQTHGLAELHALRGFETHPCHRLRILRGRGRPIGPPALRRSYRREQHEKTSRWHQFSSFPRFRRATTSIGARGSNASLSGGERSIDGGHHPFLGLRPRAPVRVVSKDSHRRSRQPWVPVDRVHGTPTVGVEAGPWPHQSEQRRRT
jgi:hypothetical protein